MTLGRMENFSREALVRYMQEAGINQATLAVYCETSKPVVSAWVSGKHLPSVPFAPKIADVLGVEVMDLAGKTDPHDIDIVDLRYIRGLSAVDLATETDLPPTKIGLLEEAVSMPSFLSLNTIAGFYELPADELQRAWLARRIDIYGVKSLDYLDETTARRMKKWISFYRERAASLSDADVTETPSGGEQN